MGFFTGSKKTYVSSVVYNLAGDETARQNYLKSTIIGNIVGNDNFSITDTLASVYQKGPGITLRNWEYRAQTNYIPIIGQVSGQITALASVDISVVTAAIPHGSGQTVVVQSASLDKADYTYWADQYMQDNYPDLLDTDWTVDIDESTEVITITFADSTIKQFTPTNYDPAGLYLYASYTLNTVTQGDTVTGDTVTLSKDQTFPDVSSWTQVSSESSQKTIDLTTSVETKVSYSDGREGSDTTTTSTSTGSYTESHGVYTKKSYKGTNESGATYSELDTQYQDQTGSAVDNTPTSQTTTETLSDGTVKTTVVMTTTQSVSVNKSYRIDTQNVDITSFGNAETFIYKKGSGNSSLDALFSADTSVGNYFPFIPFRIKSQFISESTYPTVYAASKKAFKQAVNGDYDDIMSKIADNADIGKIQFVYNVFGVSLNVLDNSCKKYVYKFFQMILQTQDFGTDDYDTWKTEWASADASQTAWNTWYAAQSDPTNSLYGTTEPTRISYPVLPVQSVRIASDNNKVMDFDMKINWSSIKETTGTGVLDSTKKVGELWFEVGVSDSFNQTLVDGTKTTTTTVDVDAITLNWQDSSNTYRQLKIYGLQHQNFIYNGKSVDISGKDALNDSDESGFIIPLNTAVYRAMSVMDSTQMATACCFLVFNCYKVVKTKWYQTGLFKIILVIVIIVISYFTFGAGSTLMGPAMAMGESLGLTGLTAAIVGAIANMALGMIVAKIITPVSDAIFGKKIGDLIGSIASAIVVEGITSVMQGGDFFSAFENINASTLISYTEQGVKAFASYEQMDVQDVINKSNQLLSQEDSEGKSITQKIIDEFGLGTVTLDPLQIADVGGDANMSESADTFLQRSLLTGTDIATITNSLVQNFADITLNLPQAIS